MVVMVVMVMVAVIMATVDLVTRADIRRSTQQQLTPMKAPAGLLVVSAVPLIQDTLCCAQSEVVLHKADPQHCSCLLTCSDCTTRHKPFARLLGPDTTKAQDMQHSSLPCCTLHHLYSTPSPPRPSPGPFHPVASEPPSKHQQRQKPKSPQHDTVATAAPNIRNTTRTTQWGQIRVMYVPLNDHSAQQLPPSPYLPAPQVSRL